MRKILLLSILLSFGIVGYSQKIVSVSNPLEEYFQKNYDSTIFFYKSNIIEPYIYIISKKGSKLYNYKYNYTTFQDLVIDRNFVVGPLDNELKEVFKNRLEKFKKTKPSINQYFTYYNSDSVNNIKISQILSGNGEMVYELSSPLWIILQNFDFWSIKEESNEEFKDYNNSNMNEIKDVFIFITKGQVKKVEFQKDETLFYEKEGLRKKVNEIKGKIFMSFNPIH